MSGVGVGQLASVVLVGFEPIFALGLAVTLGSEGKVEVLARDLELDVLEAAVRRMIPCVVVVEGREPRVLRRCLASLCGEAGVLVLASAPTLAYEQLVLDAGGLCLDRRAHPEDVLGAVRYVAGRSPGVGSGRGVASQQGVVPLTRREREVLVCITEGMTHKETAQALNVGLRTVHTYSERLCRKFNARSKKELVAMPAVAHKWTGGADVSS